MPQENMSKRIGTSPSPMVNRVIQNNKAVQMPLKPATATKMAYNKKPVNCNKS